VIIALLLAYGPWEITIPVDGLNDKNAAAFRERIVAHLRTLKDIDGRGLAVRVRTSGDVATITMECPVDVVPFEDLAKALEGSEFAVKTDTWRVKRNVAFRWRSAEKLADPKKIEAEFAEVGRGCEKSRVESIEIEGGWEHRLHLSFAKDGDAPADKVMLILDKLAGCRTSIVFVKGDRGGALAVRAPRKEGGDR